MKTYDEDKFFNLINVCAVSYRQKIEEAQIAIYWELLSEYEFHDVEQAFKKHLQTNKFFPAISEIIEHIPAAQKSSHIGADEAWSIAKVAMNDANTVVTTDQIIEAWGIAYPLYSERDETAARMAFRDAYNRIIKTAPENPKWFASTGGDKAQIAGVIAKAIALGRLPKGSDEKHRIIGQETTVTALLNGCVEKTNLKQKALELIHNQLNSVKKPQKTLEMLTEEDRKLKMEEQKKYKTNMINNAYLRQIESGAFGKGLIGSLFSLDENNLPDFLKDCDDNSL